MSGKAARILISEKQQEILQIIVRSTTVPQRLIQRARIILLSFERVRNEEIATQVGLSRKQVGSRSDCGAGDGSSHLMRSCRLSVVSHTPRPGEPSKWS